MIKKKDIPTGTIEMPYLASLSDDEARAVERYVTDTFCYIPIPGSREYKDKDEEIFAADIYMLGDVRKNIGRLEKTRFFVNGVYPHMFEEEMPHDRIGLLFDPSKLIAGIYEGSAEKL